MIRKNLLQMIFSGACLWRWNDKLRPLELSEIEKQAHKMLVACALWHETVQNATSPAACFLGRKIIEGALFDYFYRLVITDIKPPVFYKIRHKNEHYQRLTEYVLKTLEPVLSPFDIFWKDFQRWHLNLKNGETEEGRILRAAHLYASRWEFKLIKPHNPFDEEMESIDQSFTDELSEYASLQGVNELLKPGHALYRFANLCGQLRFQIRWTQTPRIPATSVLGHMFIVATISYFFSTAINACDQRKNNNFLCGLFHDFPEVLTRDIISPVKQSYSGLSQLIREYETDELERRVLEPLRTAGMTSFADRIGWYLGLEAGSEFRETCRQNGKVIVLKDMNELEKFNLDQFDPKDGALIKICDLLAAFLEAHNSIRNGAASPELVEGKARLKNSLVKMAPEHLHIDTLLADFD